MTMTVADALPGIEVSVVATGPTTGRCHWCHKALGEAAKAFCYKRQVRWSCGDCPKHFKPALVGTIVGNDTEGLYRVLARRVCSG